MQEQQDAAPAILGLPWVEDAFPPDMLPDDTPEPARAVLVPSPPSALASMPPSPPQPPPQPPPVAYTAVLPMTRPAQRSKPVPKDIWLWVPAVLAIIGKECEVDSQLAMRAGMTMRTNATTGLLEFEFVGLHDLQGQYLCRYVRAVFQRLGKKLELSGWNALARHLRDPKTWDNSANGGEDLHNVRLFWAGSARGGNPTSSGGRQLYVERRQAQDPCYYRPGKRLAPGDEGGLPGATMQLARLLQERLEHGCTVHGVDLDPNPSLFAEARRQVEFLTAADAQMVAKALYKPENVPKPGSDAGLTPEAKEEVKALKKRGDKLVQGARFTEAADAYAQAHELHPDNQVLPKLVQKQRDAVMDTDYVAAQLAARGGTEIRWQDFVECWQSRPSVISPQLPGPPVGPPPGPPLDYSSQARSTSPPRRASRDDDETGSRMERMRSDRTDRSSGSSMASSMGGSMSSVYAGSGGGGSDCWHSGKNRELRQQLERMGDAVPRLIGAKKRGGRGSGSRGDYKRSSPAEAVPPPSLRASLEDLINGGFLYKAGEEGVFYTPSWKKRFFQLEGKLLKYYDKEPAAGGTYKGEIDLDQVNLDEPIVTVPGAEQEFKLRTSGRDWHFRWDNDCTGGSADTWKQGFLSVVKRASQRLSEMSRTHSR